MPTTTAVAVPLTTLVPMKQMLARSSRAVLSPARASARLALTLPSVSYFSTGSASPVRMAWLMNRSRDCSSRMSAGIMSPACSSTISPGTSSFIGNSRRAGSPDTLPRRTTVAVLRTIDLSFSAARPKRYSWMNRSSPLIVTMVNMMMMPLQSRSVGAANWMSVKYDTATSPSSTSTKGLRKARSNCSQAGAGLSCATSFSPSVARRAATSASVKPSRCACRVCRLSCIDSPAWRATGMARDLPDAGDGGTPGLPPRDPRGAGSDASLTCFMFAAPARAPWDGSPPVQDTVAPPATARAGSMDVGNRVRGNQCGTGAGATPTRSVCTPISRHRSLSQVNTGHGLPLSLRRLMAVQACSPSTE